jgi:hypothetical protein
MRSKSSVLLEFDQLLNLRFGPAGIESDQEELLSTSLRRFYLDVMGIVSRADLKAYAANVWLPKQKQPQLSRSELRQSLDTILS